MLSDKYPPLVSDVDSCGGYAHMGQGVYGEFLYLPLKTALKKKVLKKTENRTSENTSNHK